MKIVKMAHHGIIANNTNEILVAYSTHLKQTTLQSLLLRDVVGDVALQGLPPLSTGLVMINAGVVPVSAHLRVA
jgi:hypothetical protein